MTKDRWLFVVCLLLATVFWSMQKLSSNYRFTLKYSVSYKIPDGKIFKRSPTMNVEVTLVGIGWDLLSKSAKSIGDKIEVELSRDNNQVIPSSAIAEKINAMLASEDISVAQIRPATIEVVLEDQANKKVPVVSNLNIVFQPGYYIKKEMQFTPDSVTLTGAPQLLDEIDAWRTQVLHINKLNKSIVDMPIPLESSRPDILRVSSTSVRMNLEIEEFTEKTFNIPLRIKNAENQVRTLPNMVHVKCVVGLSKYDLLTEEDIELYINMDESLIDNKLNYAPIGISRLPTYVRHIQYEPKVAKYFLVQ